MECHNIIKNLKINKEKSIGEVVIVVEGENDEFRLLKKIFTKILDYNYISLKRNKVLQHEFKSKSNKNSTVIIANTNSSSIKSIINDGEYKDKLYNLLKGEYQKSLKNIPIYILWDRDKNKDEKNDATKKDYETALETFANSRDNEYEMNGILLLSYPCHESYNLSNFKKQLWREKFATSDECKKQFNSSQYTIKKMDENTLKLAVENMNRSLLNYGIRSYDPSDFKRINKTVFRKEEEIFKGKKYFDALSLISIMFIDLGIIENVE